MAQEKQIYRGTFTMMSRKIATALATVATVTSSADASPLEKVITMLEDLQIEVVTEGKAEANTYDKFACFCKDVTSEKMDAIQTGQDEQESLLADIESETATREELDGDIAEFL